AAAGANVTSFDVSEEQLAKDQLVAERDSLKLDTIQGDMADLTALDSKSFDLIFHATSNVFCEDIQPVWNECFRVLKPDGRLLSGFMNPLFFLFNHEQAELSGTLEVAYALPFSDLKSLPKHKLEDVQEQGIAYEFSHTLEDQIGGQLAAGFVIAGFYE